MPTEERIRPDPFFGIRAAMSESEAKGLPKKFRHEVVIRGVGEEPESAGAAMAEAVRWALANEHPQVRPLGVRVSHDVVTIDGDLLGDVPGSAFMSAMNGLGAAIAKAARSAANGSRSLVDRTIQLPRSGEDAP